MINNQEEIILEEREWRNKEDNLDVLMMKEMHGNVLDTLLLTNVSNCIYLQRWK